MADKDYYFLKLKKVIKKANKGYNLSSIEAAYMFAKEAHSGQFRLLGQPYISHPVGVAIILIELGMDTNSIVAGLLHDVLEDTKISREVLEEKFGANVLLIVEGVTKLKTAVIYNSDNMGGGTMQQQVENIRKMLLAMAKDVRVIIVKLADRLHNMRTAKGWPDQKRRKKALETMEIYAPLAQRLGVTVVKEELQDLSLKILDPIAYDEISKMLKLKQKAKNFNGYSYIKHLESKVLKAIKPLVSSVQISGRVKSHYAIYFKIYINGKDWDEVFDIYAIRIVVNTILECYGVLGAVHSLFKPLQNRFKDYIAIPKANYYQSLHTTVMDSGGEPFEVQIRTKQMQYMAEYGIAAHWKYKQKIESEGRLEEKLSWVRRIIEMQQESENVDDFFRLFKTDLGSEEVFVFTPAGEVKSLPVGSTVIDFAYLISSKLGNKMVGAKINGKAVPIESKIESNQVVEILTTTSKNYGPDRNWLSIVKTSEARNKIRLWFKKERRNENIKRGREEMKKEFLRNGIKLNKTEELKFVQKIASFKNFDDIDEFYAAVGYGAINVSKMVSKIKDIYLEFRQDGSKMNLKMKSVKIASKPMQVLVEGIGSCLVTLAKCCNPIPGCSIIGFITKNKGISVHCVNCPNVRRIQNNVNRQNRFINVHFDENLNQAYFSTLKIIGKNSDSLISSISSKLISLKVKIISLNADYLSGGEIHIKISVSVFCVSQLKNVVRSLEKIKGVAFVGISTKF